MNWNSWKFFKLMDEAGDKGAGGGGADAAAKAKAQADADAKELAEFRAAKAKANDDKKAADDGDLAEKARKEAADRDQKKGDVRVLESAINFNVKAQTFLKDNAALLPKDAEEIFKLADKETYDSPVEKASEIKAALVSSYFSVQENLDSLTASQKASIAEFLKLSKTGRQEKAHQIFESIFEPAMESSRRIKKAAQLANSRNGYGDDSDKAMKDKLIAASQKHYTGVKNA